jgi:hypothetical protein
MTEEYGPRMRTAACALICGALLVSVLYGAGGAAGRGASRIQFSFRTYANNIRVVSPLVGKWQLGKAWARGSGSMSGDNIAGSIVIDTDPLYNQYPAAKLRADVIGYRYVQAAHDKFRKLTMTVEVVSATNGGENCIPGVRGILTVNDSKVPLASNGEPSDYVTLNHWTGSDCPTFVMGWTNADGGRRTSPARGGYPHGGQWAVVNIASSS